MRKRRQLLLGPCMYASLLSVTLIRITDICVKAHTDRSATTTAKVCRVALLQLFR
jgi:hypothetical protein